MEIKNRLKDLVISRLMVFVVQANTVPLKVSDFPYLSDLVFPDCGALQKEAGDLFCDRYRTLPADSCIVDWSAYADPFPVKWNNKAIPLKVVLSGGKWEEVGFYNYSYELH